MDKSISEKDVSKPKNKPFIPDELSLCVTYLHSLSSFKKATLIYRD